MGNPFSSPSNHQEGHFRNSIGDSLSPGGAVASTPSDRPVIPTAPVMTNANPPSFSSWQDGNLDYNLDHRTCQPTQVRIPQNTPEVKVAKVTYGPEGYDGNKCLVSGTCGSGPLDRKALAMIMMDGDDVPEIQCPCGSGPCIVLTSGTKKNPNRRFYKCPAENKCNFFKWCDELGQNSQSPLKPNQQWTRSPGKIIKSPSTPLGYKGRQGPICSCKAGLCVVRTMNEGENKGRKYYACSIKKGQGACNHFKWVDDPVKPPEPENNLNGNQNNLLIADVTTPDPKQTRSPYESVKDLFGENDMRTIEFWNKDQNDPNSATVTIENEIRKELSPGKRPYQPSTIGEISPMKRLNLDDASPVLEYCRNCLAIGQCTDCPILACFKDGDFAKDKHENVMDGGNNNSYSADISPIGGTLVKNISPSPSTGSLKRSGKCFNCGKEGHWSNECTSPRTNSKCFKCGKVGHWMKNCNM